MSHLCESFSTLSKQHVDNNITSAIKGSCAEIGLLVFGYIMSVPLHFSSERTNTYGTKFPESEGKTRAKVKENRFDHYRNQKNAFLVLEYLHHKDMIKYAQSPHLPVQSVRNLSLIHLLLSQQIYCHHRSRAATRVWHVIHEIRSVLLLLI